MLLSRISAVSDLQCAWLILLFCASARANYLLRVHPSWSQGFATTHNNAVWNCLCGLLDIAGTHQMRDRASISLSKEGLGIRSATRDRDSAFWASWADALPTIRERHPSVADQFSVALQRGDGGFHMGEATSCRERLMERGFDCPAWQRIATGSGFARRPHARGARRGWQRGAVQHSTLRTNSAPTSCLNSSSTSRLCSVPRAVLSQGSRLFAPPSLRRPDLNPSSSVCCFRRLWCPLPLCVASCRCGPTRSLWPPLRSLPACRFWDGGGSCWRAQQHAFVEKPEHAFRPMCARSSLHCQGMVQPSASVPELMVQPWSKPDDAKNAPVQSWRRCTVEHGWLSWRAKSAAGGLPNRCVSSTSWQRPRSEMSPKSSGTW